MFSFFASIFGLSDNNAHTYPDSLIINAIERALDATDPRMRILPGYRKALRSAVIHAIDHVIALVDALPAAVLATPQSREASSSLAALFTSAPRMNELLLADNNLRTFLAAAQPAPAQVYGLLVVQRNEKTGFGYALVDDQLLNDVQQTQVSFDEHRLLDLAESENENRRLLKHRAYDYLLSVALRQVTEQRDEREKLSQQRSLLRCKLDIIQKGGNGFSRDMGPQDRNALQARLDEIEMQLAELGPVHELLQNNMAIVVNVLNEAEKHLWRETVNLRLDKHYVLHSDGDESVAPIAFTDICDSEGKRVTVQLLFKNVDQ